MVDLSRFLVFAGLVSLVLVAAGASLVDALLPRLGSENLFAAAAVFGRHPWLRGLVLGASGLVVAALAYARFVEPFWPEVTRVQLASAKLPDHAPPIRLVLLSDLHSDPQPRLEERLPVDVAELQPDAIIFAGDAINSRAGLPVFRACMKRLAKVAPTFAVRGNWEDWWFRDVDLYSDTGVEVLRGKAVPLVVRGARIWLTGFDVRPVRVGASVSLADSRIERALPLLRSELVVFVHHFPEIAAQAARLGADVGLAGDTHGGQLRLPWLGALIRIYRASEYLDVGLHQIASQRFLYVSRGIGMEGGLIPRVRFLCRPEITVVELVPAT